MFRQSIVTSAENFKKIFPDEEMRLGLWLVFAAEKILGEQLSLYMVDIHILGTMKEALNVIITGIYLMQTSNINLCMVVER